MRIEEFTERLNQWGRKKVPFLFLVDFEQEKPFVCRLEDALAENIFFDINGVANAGRKSKKNSITLKKYQIPFRNYRKKFEVVFGHLNYGDTFLTNLTIKTKIQPDRSMRDLFDLAKAKYKILFKDQFLVFSPETFVRIADGKIYSYPMKGTLDADLPDARRILIRNKKELAEHTTVVDLIRNDLSQVASQVTVARFRYLEEVKTSGKTLLQMSSEIVGQLSIGYRSELGDILLHLLPAGSVSGAPKLKTLEIIKKAEQEKRGYYTGIFGYFNGEALDSGVMIRFIEKEKDNFFYRSGGGITTQSTAQEEYQEAFDKIYVPID